MSLHMSLSTNVGFEAQLDYIQNIHTFVVKHKHTVSSFAGATCFPCNESSMVPLNTLVSSIPVGAISGVLGTKSTWEGKG